MKLNNLVKQMKKRLDLVEVLVQVKEKRLEEVSKVKNQEEV